MKMGNIHQSVKKSHKYWDLDTCNIAFKGPIKVQILSITKAIINECILKVSGKLIKYGENYVVTSLQTCRFQKSGKKAQQTPKLSYCHLKSKFEFIKMHQTHRQCLLFLY